MIAVTGSVDIASIIIFRKVTLHENRINILKCVVAAVLHSVNCLKLDDSWGQANS